MTRMERGERPLVRRERALDRPDRQVPDDDDEEHDSVVDCPTQLTLISHLWIFLFVRTNIIQI